GVGPPVSSGVVPPKHPPEATSFWENFELERQLAIKEVKKKFVWNATLSLGVNFFKNFYCLLVSRPKPSAEDDDPFINNNRTEGFTHSKATPSSLGSQSLEMPIGSYRMTSDINDVNNSECDIPRTPPHQIRSTSKNQDLLERLRQEKERTKSTYEPICSNIIDTTNKLLMDRLQIKRDYTWDPVTNEATKYIDELIDNQTSTSICSPDKTY
ncbi:1993_t:CDS:2, partial [Paraglomus occultum]